MAPTKITSRSFAPLPPLQPRSVLRSRRGRWHPEPRSARRPSRSQLARPTPFPPRHRQRSPRISKLSAPSSLSSRRCFPAARVSRRCCRFSSFLTDLVLEVAFLVRFLQMISNTKHKLLITWARKWDKGALPSFLPSFLFL